MTKNEKIISLLPYKIKTNSNYKYALTYFKKKRKWIFILLIIASVVCLTFIINSILNKFQNTKDYFLVSSALLTFITIYMNYRQYKYADEEIKEALDLYSR